MDREEVTDLNMADARDRHAIQMTLEHAMDCYLRFNGCYNDRVKIFFGITTPRGVSIEQFQKIGRVAKQNRIGITMHCAEAQADHTIYHEKYDCTPLEFVQKAELASDRTILAHVVHSEPTPDFAIMRETGTTVSHNPSSNCKLGSGIAPVPDMIHAGINVALGTDGGPCNNSYDMIREMHLAAIIHAADRQNAGVLTAYDALEMATINGAKALGMQHDLGSLEIGKFADFVVVNPNTLACAPFNLEDLRRDDGGVSAGMDPVTVLVHGCTGDNVEKVVIGGVLVVDDKIL